MHIPKSLRYFILFQSDLKQLSMIFLILRVVRCLLVLVWLNTLPKIWQRSFSEYIFTISAWDVLKKKSLRGHIGLRTSLCTSSRCSVLLYFLISFFVVVVVISLFLLMYTHVHGNEALNELFIKVRVLFKTFIK